MSWPDSLPVLVNRPGLDEIQTRVGTYESFLDAMLARLDAARIPGTRPQRDGQDAAAALTDAWASVADILAFYQERIANEAYLRTATERRSVTEIGRLVGYRLRPGVAAGVPLAFTLEANATAILPVGTCVQSVPVGEEHSRRFELVEEIEARAAWNRLAVRTTRPTAADPSLAEIFTAGVTAAVRPGDAVVLVGQGTPKLRRIASVTSEFTRERCRIALAPETAPVPATAPGTAVPGGRAEATATDDADNPLKFLGDLVDDIRTGLDRAVNSPPRAPTRLRQNLADILAPDNDIAMRLRGLSVRDRATGKLFAAMNALRAQEPAAIEMHVLKLRTAPFGSSAPPPTSHLTELLDRSSDWALEGEDPRVLYIEAVAGEIMPGSWVAFEAPADPAVQPPRRVLSASVVVRVAYGVTVRCTRLELDGPWLTGMHDFAALRRLTVFVGSVPVALAEEDDPDPIGETDQIELDSVVGELTPGRTLIVEGELARHPGARMSEVVMLAASNHVLPVAGSGATHAYTVLHLANKLAYQYRPDNVQIWGNVARATEGETVAETLGYGRTSLSRRPLTYVSAVTPSGAASTLQVNMNGITWQEVASLAEAGPNDRVFVTVADGAGAARILFGDGVNGAKPPGGDVATVRYRTGLGAGGNCVAGQINQLLSRPAGVHAVTNPRPATGGADPEDIDSARARVPLGVTALSRLVGLRDYEDFARSFAGAGKADAMLFEGADGPRVLITIAGPDSTPIAPESDLVHNLVDALEVFGDLSHTVIVLPARIVRAVLAAHIGLLAGYNWDKTAPRIRTMLLDRFGFARRNLGQPLWQSEVVAAIQAVEGIGDVRVDVLAGLGDPVTTEMLANLVNAREAGDVTANRSRLSGDACRTPLPAEVTCFSTFMPELISLTEIGA